MRLDKYRQGEYSPGAPLWKQVLWHFFGSCLLTSGWLSSSRYKVLLLRSFGAELGRGVRIKPGVRVKFPWRLRIGEHSWIGEDVWIDNLAEVNIGNHCCISQGAYLCTGSHDWSSDSFDLITSGITLEDHSWVAARSVVAPGVIVEEGAVLALGSVATTRLEPWKIYAGNPAVAVRDRRS